MHFERLTGKKVREWVRRYLPNEIAGTVCELGGAAIAYLATESVMLAAVSASVAATVGYYATAFVAAVRWSYRAQAQRGSVRRVLLTTVLALRSVAIEFGPAELFDSIFVRPLAFFVGPQLFGNMLAGWIFGKVVADIGFYACAIVSYERFKGLLARESAKEPHGEPGAPLAQDAA